jgi:hypothetical protein
MKRRSPRVKTDTGRSAGSENSDAPITSDGGSPQRDDSFIVPPGLHYTIDDFEAHWNVSDKEPILILGATGVGKSLFLHLTKELFKKQHAGERKKRPIVEANCGHFSGTHSDLNMIRSELFGHVKGSHNMAYKDKVGLVELANGGLLILEEIGELPSEAQALLLTFVETGEYRRVGDDNTRKANAKIVGATNRKAALRDDFSYRFFPFYIQSLRERKQDILYYFHAFFPHLIKTLNMSEVLVLLTHHWPGNVREVERVGRLLLRRRWKPEPKDENREPEAKTGKDEKLEAPDAERESEGMDQVTEAGATNIGTEPDQTGGYRDFGLYHLDPRDSPFVSDVLFNLTGDLRFHLADMDLLEELLNWCRVSLDDQNPSLAFEGFIDKMTGDLSYPADFNNVKICYNFSPFIEAFQGYLTFCGLFLQDPAKEENILASLRKCNIEYFSLKGLDHPKIDEAKVHKLATAVMAYLKDFDTEDLRLPKVEGGVRGRGSLPQL